METNLKEIYGRLKKMLKMYENPLMPKFDLDSKYDLWSFKDLMFEGRKRKEMYFAGLIIQSSYVGFYFMPVYTDVTIKKFIKPELLNTLKGKSCFHIKKLDDFLELQISEVLDRGYELYKNRGWI